MRRVKRLKKTVGSQSAVLTLVVDPSLADAHRQLTPTYLAGVVTQIGDAASRAGAAPPDAAGIVLTRKGAALVDAGEVTAQSLRRLGMRDLQVGDMLIIAQSGQKSPNLFDVVSIVQLQDFGRPYATALDYSTCLEGDLTDVCSLIAKKAALIGDCSESVYGLLKRYSAACAASQTDQVAAFAQFLRELSSDDHAWTELGQEILTSLAILSSSRSIHIRQTATRLLRASLSTRPAGRPQFPADVATSAIVFETWLTAQVSSILGVPTSSIDVREPLASYGFDSLMAAEVCGRIETDLGSEVQLGEFLRRETIESLAEWLGANRGPGLRRESTADRAALLAPLPVLTRPQVESQNPASRPRGISAFEDETSHLTKSTETEARMPERPLTSGGDPSKLPIVNAPEDSAGEGAPRGPWKPRLSQYSKHAALAFKTKENIEKVIDRLWDSDCELYGIPRTLADGETMVVPAEAVALFRRLGIPFDEQAVSRGRS